MRAVTLALSVAAHLVFLALVLGIPLLATGELPEPHRVVEFVHVIPVVPSPPPALRAREKPVNRASSSAAPVQEPQGVQPETDPTLPEPFDVGPSLIDGVPLNSIVNDVPLPPPPAPQDREPIRVGGAITRPERVHHVPPVYPEVARVARIKGTVILEAVIGIDGTVRDVRVLRSVPLLDAAAVEAVRQWLFNPTRLNGEPVPVVMTVTVTFQLR
jgi:periplasmic protein TonB